MCLWCNTLSGSLCTSNIEWLWCVIGLWACFTCWMPSVYRLNDCIVMQCMQMFLSGYMICLLIHPIPTHHNMFVVCGIIVYSICMQCLRRVIFCWSVHSVSMLNAFEWIHAMLVNTSPSHSPRCVCCHTVVILPCGSCAYIVELLWYHPAMLKYTPLYCQGLFLHNDTFLGLQKTSGCYPQTA